MKYDFTTLPDRSKSGAEKFVNMRRKDPDVPDEIIPFSVADMDFLPPPELTGGLKDFIDGSVFGYTLPSDSYYEAILDWARRRHRLDLRREWLLDADHVIAALYQMIYAFTKPGDGIVLLTPAYPPFAKAAEVTGRTLYECPLLFTENRYSIHFSLLEDLCRRQNVSLLVFCNPHNPVGRVWSRRELETVAEICLRNHVFVASDEIHWDLILPGGRFTSMAGLDRRYTDNCAVSTASTKTFNTAAFKGAVVIMTDASRRERFIKCGGVSGRDLFSFQACELAYRRCEAWLDELLCVLDSNRKLMRDFLRDRLPEIGVIPLEATYLQWLDFRFLGLDAQELEDFMAFRARCFFTEGRKFGSAGIGFERWSIACPQKVLLAGLERMEKAVRAFRRAD